MRPQTILLLVTVWCAIAFDASAGDGKRPTNDANGDALPADALMRMGSVRFRHGEPITFIAYPPSGKTLITATNGAKLLVWDRKTGKLIRRLTTPVENAGTPNPNPFNTPRAAMTLDGKLLAVVTPTGGVLFWEVETGKIVRQFKGASQASAVCFSPNGKMLAVRGNGGTHLYETETGKELLRLNSDANTRSIVFSPDSKTVAIPHSTSIAFYDTTTGKSTRRIDLITSHVNCLAFSPDGKRFAYNGNYLVYVIAADTGKEVNAFNSNYGAFSMVFSPDSQSLAIQGSDGILQLFDPATGKLLRALGNDNPKRRVNLGFVAYRIDIGNAILFSPDGKSLVLGGCLTPRIFDVDTGFEHPIPGGGHRGAVTAVAATPDGKTLVTRGADNIVRTWNVATGAEIRQFATPSDTSSTAFSPDAKFIATGSEEGMIRLIDSSTGMEKWQFHGHARGTAALTFTSDGKMLASRGAFDGMLRVFDVAKGVEINQMTYHSASIRNDGRLIVEYNGRNPPGQTLLFAPDGRSLVVQIAPSQQYGQQPPALRSLRFWDIATGKLIRQIELPAGRTIESMVYSPDGRLLIGANSNKTLSIWELASGRERSQLGTTSSKNTTRKFDIDRRDIYYGPAEPVGAIIAISPDGSLIALPGENHTVRVWDAMLEKQIGTFEGHFGDITSLAFGRDGKVLLSGSKDSTVLVWDVTRLKRDPQPPGAELSPKEFAALWSDLLSNDAVAAGKAVRSLLLASNSAVTHLRTRMHPAANAETMQIEQWIRDLDSSSFAKRALAMSQLEKVGAPAVPAMEHMLTTPISLETRRRIQPLLDKLKSGGFSAEQIRIVRAIEALEKIATPEAKRLLETLANGGAASLTTQQARSALDRLHRARR